MSDVKLGRDEDQNQLITIHIRNSKTDQFNEGDFKTLRTVSGQLCPVKMMAKLMTVSDWSCDSEKKVFGKWLRNRLCALLRMAGTAMGIPASRIGNHSLRSGGATAMWRAGYDVEVIKRWGRWRSASFQGYLWDDHRTLATIGLGMLTTRGNTYQFVAQGATKFDDWSANAGRAGGKGKGRGKGRRHSVEYLSTNPSERLRALSKAMSKELRHENHDDRQRNGFMPMASLLNARSIRELFGTQEDVRKIVRGEGSNHKMRFEIGAMSDEMTVAIRASQGHSYSSGAADDVLPVAENLLTVIHGTTLEAAKSIIQSGISRGSRNHVHFYESDLEGRPEPCEPRVRLMSEVIVVVSAEKCERYGMVFYRAPNGVIVTTGVNGVVPPECILCVRQIPSYRVLWSTLSKRWGSASAPVIGLKFGGKSGTKRDRQSREEVQRSGSSRDVRLPSEESVGEGSESDNGDSYRIERADQRKKGRPNEAYSSGTLQIPNVSPFSDSDGEVELHTDTQPNGNRLEVANTTFTRTAGRSPSLLSDRPPDSLVTRSWTRGTVTHSNAPSPSESSNEEEVGETVTTCQYPATPTSSQGGETSLVVTRKRTDGESSVEISTKWVIGQPYYRDSRAEQQSNGNTIQQSNGGQVIPPPGIGFQWGNNVNGTLHPNGQYANNQVFGGGDYYGSSSSVFFDPRWASPRESGPSTALPNNNGQSSSSSSNVSLVAGTTSMGPPVIPYGAYNFAGCTDQMSPEYRTLQEQQMQNRLTAGGEWVPYLPKPTAKKAVHQLRNQTKHGDRVRDIADAQRLWGRLDDHDQNGPEDPLEGFSEAVIEYAKLGREYVQMALETSTTQAWKWWRSQRRAHVNTGKDEEELYEEFREAIRQYRLRRGR